MGVSKPEVDGASIVLVGSFNPAIFHPAWLAHHHLISDQAAEAAKVNVVTAELADFRVEDWLILQVLTDRFIAQTTDPAFHVALRDLVVGVFTLLEHTPVQKMGLNRDMHFAVAGLEQWHAIGHTLAPKKLWIDHLEAPGLRSLMIEGRRASSKAKFIRFKIEPSEAVHPGVYVQSNEHFERAESVTATVFMDELKLHWSDALTFGLRVAQQVLEHAGGQH